MFDIGWSELLVVGLVALIVVGPKELPGMMRKIGQMIKKVKQTASSFQRQFEDAMDEGELGELKTSMTELGKELNPEKIIGDLGNIDDAGDIDDFNLDDWNEQILDDEKKRLANPIRTPEEVEQALADNKDVEPVVPVASEPQVAEDKSLSLEPVNENEPRSQGKQIS